MLPITSNPTTTAELDLPWAVDRWTPAANLGQVS